MRVKRKNILAIGLGMGMAMASFNENKKIEMNQCNESVVNKQEVSILAPLLLVFVGLD